MKLNKKTFLTLSLCVCLVSYSNAQIITDRPDQTESSSTVGNGNLQIESGLLIGFEGDNQLSTQQILAPTNLFRYGVSDGLELRFLSQFEMLKDDIQAIRGISDIEIGTKIQVLKKEDVNTEIAFLTHLVIPTGTEALSSGEFGTINKVSISHELNDNIELGYNLGYDYFGQGAGNFTYSIALGIGVNEKVGIYVEPFGELTNFEDFILNFDAGFTYLANDNLQYDFSFGTGLNQEMNYISIGLSWLIMHE